MFVMFLLIGATGTLSAQVQGLSYTLSPYGEYQLFSDKSGLGDGWAVGGQFGFGFGEFVELRADYSRSIDLQTDIDQFNLDVSEIQRMNYMQKDVDITRYGGQVKFNLSRGPLSPYITLGTGVQEIALDTFDANKQIYLEAGAGIKFSAANRYTVGLQAINRSYNSNPYSNLMTADDRDDLGVNLASSEAGLISNWSIRGSLIFYVGGRRPGEMSDIDRAYLDNFSGGFSGLSIPAEFVVSKMDFHEDLPYKDTWMAGGSAGLNFGPLVGVRGFYWRALEDGKTTSLEDLSMYGGEARFKLNEGKGFTPWLTVGGGNIHVGEGYRQVVDSIELGNKAFAMGGIGLDLPFSKYVKATAFARSILTTIPGVNSEDVAAPDELKSSWNYGVSLNFVLGKNKKKIEVVKQDVFEDYMLASEEQQALATQQLKAEYEARIQKLEAEIELAIQESDAAAVKDLSEEKNRAEQIVNELSDSKISAKTQPAAPAYVVPQTNAPAMIDQSMMSTSSVIKMTPAEFQLLIKELLEQVQQQRNALPAAPSAAPANPIIAPTQNLGTGSTVPTYEFDRINDNISELAKLQQQFVIEASKQEMASENELLKIMNRLDQVESNINATLGLMQQADDNRGNSKDNNVNTPTITKSDVQDAIDQAVERDRLRNDIKRLNERLTSFEERIVEALNKNAAQQAKNNSTPMSVDANQSAEEVQATTVASNKEKVEVAYDQNERTGFSRKLRYKGMSGIAGFGVGNSATFNIGYRIHYQIGSDSSRLTFMPETFFGFGSPSAFGIIANGVYDLSWVTKSRYINPYVGAGFGFMKVGESGNEDKLVGALNFILGTSLNVLNGDLFVDFSARNLFKYNQLVVGYRFPF